MPIENQAVCRKRIVFNDHKYIMRTLGANTGSLSMHPPANLGVLGGLIFLASLRLRAF
jgi:hypothetical protein